MFPLYKFTITYLIHYTLSLVVKYGNLFLRINIIYFWIYLWPNKNLNKPQTIIISEKTRQVILTVESPCVKTQCQQWPGCQLLNRNDNNRCYQWHVLACQLHDLRHRFLARSWNQLPQPHRHQTRQPWWKSERNSTGEWLHRQCETSGVSHGLLIYKTRLKMISHILFPAL